MLEDTPRFEKALEILITVELELHPSTFAASPDGDLRAEALLKLGLPLAEAM